jgi:predicted lysophospholipase L1 biosynthesis ABC-type transport system permease subunit
VLIVDESFARRMFGTTNVVGQRVLVGRSATAPTAEIVGVVSNAQLSRPSAAPGGVVYGANSQARNLVRLCLVVRVSGSPAGAVQRIREEIRSADPKLPVLEIDTGDQQLDRALFRDRLVTRLALAFGAVALILACVGLYGVIAYLAERRTREIGVRMALGATAGGIVRMILGQAARMVAVGTVLGIGLVWLAKPTVMAQVQSRGGDDPMALATVIVLMCGIAVVAALIPASRAAKTNPIRAIND